MTLSASALRDVLARRIAAPIRWSRFRPGFSAAAKGHREGMAERERHSRLSPTRRATLALEALRRVVRHAGDRVPFYRERFRRAGFDWRAPFTLAEYAGLPPLERSDVALAGDALLAEGIDRSRLIPDATGGSTGEPLRYLLDPFERGYLDAGLEWHARSLGASRGARTALFYGGEADPLARKGLGRRIRDLAANRLVFPCFRINEELLEEVHRAFTRFRPEILVAYSSAAEALARHLLASGRRADYPVVAVVAAAEKLKPEAREALAAGFAAPAFERYGSREAGLVAAEGPPGGGPLAVDLAHAIAEPGEAPAGSRAAPILVTKLAHYSMPFLRYRIGDVAVFDPRHRPADGLPFVALASVEGRDMDFLVRRDGGLVHPVELPHFFKDEPVREFAAEQGLDGSVLVSVVPGDGYGPAHGRKIRGVLERNLAGFPVAVREVARIDRTPSGKRRPVVSVLGRSRFAADGRAPRSLP